MKYDLTKTHTTTAANLKHKSHLLMNSMSTVSAHYWVAAGLGMLLYNVPHLPVPHTRFDCNSEWEYNDDTVESDYNLRILFDNLWLHLH